MVGGSFLTGVNSRFRIRNCKQILAGFRLVPGGREVLISFSSIRDGDAKFHRHNATQVPQLSV
jgi:hypothetical protein